MEFNLQTPDGVIGLSIDIVDVDVHLLLGFDMLDAHRLVINNVDNLLEKRADMKEGSIEWTLPLIRQHGHLFIRYQIHIINFSDSELLKLHKHFVHPSVEKIFQLIKRARPAEADLHTRDVLERITNECNTFQRTQGNPISFKVAAIPENDLELCFNRQVDMDLICISKRPLVHMVDHDTGFNAAKFLDGETTQQVWDAFLSSWALMYHGLPHILLADQGSVFTSKMRDLLCKSEGIQLRLTPIEIHNSNGAC
jgi:hypothetical protein